MDNIKKKIIDLSSIGITDALSVSVAGMFWFFIASEIGPENYGEITFLISIAILVSGIALFGSNNTVLVLSAKKIDIHATIYLITIVANIISSIIIFALFFNLGIIQKNINTLIRGTHVVTNQKGRGKSAMLDYSKNKTLSF